MSDNKDIRSLIYTVRGQQVVLDSDLAKLYKVETKVFNQAVNRNLDRFPDNFRFQLTKEEFDALRSQIATSNGKGGRRYRPYMFTEQGIAMLSGVLRSDVAVQMSIRIMNAFVEMRRFGISLMKDNEIVIELLNRLKFFNAFKLKVILFLHISFYSFDMVAVIRIIFTSMSDLCS